MEVESGENYRVGYDSHCKGCPYFNQVHLDLEERTCRPDPPVEAEVNDSHTLIVALAPGAEEWRHCTPLMPSILRGGTAGRRVQLSWDRKKKKRSHFDITEAVQCYPGRGDGERDNEPVQKAVDACSARLRATLQKGNYRKAVALGGAAFNSLQEANTDPKLDIVEGKHPTGGASSKDLDALW